MKRIFTTLAQKWPEYFLEILVITIGILGAFALNNWNENRKSNFENERFLINLKNEFVLNQEALRLKINDHRIVDSKLLQLAEIIGPKPTMDDLKNVDSLIYAVIYLPEYQPSIVTATSSIIEDIQDDQLKRLLSNWSNKLEEYHYSTQITYNLYFNFIYPILSQHYQLKNIRGDYNYFSTQSKFNSNHMVILSDPVFENHLFMRSLNATIILKRAEELADLQEEIINYVKNQLP
ncbi:hypothetical protein [Ekhidna sp.]|uniref:hypothetical protein n=1 Tax=Ekhidna sp. TaxID=2608089 RepID=UPI003B5044F4